MIKNIADQLKAAVPSELKFSSLILLLGKVYQKLEDRVINLEARQLQKGDKGDSGIDGKNGKDGRDGRDGIDGINGLNGINGKDGKQGKAGINGKDGISIVDVEIAIDDHLVVKLSDGNIIDAGELPKTKGTSTVHVSGNAWQISVQGTAPSNPQLNDLWIQI